MNAKQVLSGYNKVRFSLVNVAKQLVAGNSVGTTLKDTSGNTELNPLSLHV